MSKWPFSPESRLVSGQMTVRITFQWFMVNLCLRYLILKKKLVLIELDDMCMIERNLVLKIRYKLVRSPSPSIMYMVVVLARPHLHYTMIVFHRLWMHYSLVIMPLFLHMARYNFLFYLVELEHSKICLIHC